MFGYQLVRVGCSVRDIVHYTVPGRTQPGRGTTRSGVSSSSFVLKPWSELSLARPDPDERDGAKDILGERGKSGCQCDRAATFVEQRQRPSQKQKIDAARLTENPNFMAIAFPMSGVRNGGLSL